MNKWSNKIGKNLQSSLHAHAGLKVQRLVLRLEFVQQK